MHLFEMKLSKHYNYLNMFVNLKCISIKMSMYAVIIVFFAAVKVAKPVCRRLCYCSQGCCDIIHCT